MASVVLFYVFVDLFSVVIVEQFWSLANSVTRLAEGRRTYWFVASGGLAGGLAGGLVASALVAHTPLETIDLLVSCAVLLVITASVNAAMWRAGLLRETIDDATLSLSGAGLHAVTSNRYLLLIALVVCLSQLAEPIVEYQFLSAVNAAYAQTDLRTQYIANFFSVMGFVSLGVNFLITPYVHRRLGVIAGLAVQPLMLGVVSSAFFAQQSVTMASIMKIADRGLSYSINRASKELLYVPIDPVITFQAKAWIDMLGYRLFKVLGSSLIVFVTFNVPQLRVAVDLAWLTVGICAVWLVAVYWLGAEQRRTLVVAPA
jgi:AAA family ATP:ADP antiporter